jgi:hypothetical protein
MKPILSLLCKYKLEAFFGYTLAPLDGNNKLINFDAKEEKKSFSTHLKLI